MKLTQVGSLGAIGAAMVLAGCGGGGTGPFVPPAGPSLNMVAVTSTNNLVRFNGTNPAVLTNAVAITGLAGGETILGLDIRPNNGLLYALGSTSQLYTIDATTGVATAVGATFAVPLSGTRFGFDFNPVPDRIRVVSNTGQNMRLNPDTGAVVDTDPGTAGVQTDAPLAFAAGDPSSGAPGVAGAAYTNSVTGAVATTNFAIDTNRNILVTQGSREGVLPAVSPNSGILFTVGALGVDAAEAAFDVSPAGNIGVAAFSIPGDANAALYTINLATGAATRIATIGPGSGISSLTVVP